MNQDANPSTRVSLLNALRAGDNDRAWAIFCGRYAPRITQWCRKWGATPQDSEDILQETLLVVFRKMAEFRYEPGTSFRSWLKTVTHRIWLHMTNHTRRHVHPPFPVARMRPDLVVDDPDTVAASEYNAILDQIADRELLELATENARLRASPLMWQSFERAALLNEPRDLVAAALGISPGFLRVNITRMRHLVRDELARLDPPETA